MSAWYSCSTVELAPALNAIQKKKSNSETIFPYNNTTIESSSCKFKGNAVFGTKFKELILLPKFAKFPRSLSELSLVDNAI